MGHPGKDWVVLAETEEDQGSRTLVRNIETFRRVDQFYRRGCEVHRIRLLTLLHSLIDPLGANSQRKLHKPTARSSLVRVVALFSTRMPPKEPAPRQMALN